MNVTVDLYARAMRYIGAYGPSHADARRAMTDAATNDAIMQGLIGYRDLPEYVSSLVNDEECDAFTERASDLGVDVWHEAEVGRATMIVRGAE